MLKTRLRWRADKGKRARQHLSDIETTIAALPDEDLLDFADIFRSAPHTLLAQIASGEMARRGISL